MIDYEQVEDQWRDELPGGGAGDLPISEEEYISQIRTNLKRDLPNIVSLPEHDRTMVMVCGGPTAKRFLGEIMEKSVDPKYDVFCSNKTHDWLIENGITPYAQFIIDPKEGKVIDVRNPQKGVKYMLGMQCHPGVFDALSGYDLYRIVSCSGTKSKSGMKDFQIVQAFLEEGTYTFHLGGTMAGLRAMTLADILGYLTVEFYGFDSCFFDYDASGVPNYYSYSKIRAEDILEVMTSDGKTWLTTPVFASQARQYLKWKHRLEWIKFIIHGDSFTAAMDLADEKENARKHNRRWSDLHLTLNKQLHTEKVDYGAFGDKFAGPIALLAGQIVRKYGPQTLLDYGCGKATLSHRLPPIDGLVVKNYDFAIPEYTQEPEPADIVVCTEVLEHVEPDCVENVLDHLQTLTKKVCFCSIATIPSFKTYSDGRNAHLSVHNHEWWYPKLRKRFDIAERQVKNTDIVFILQSKKMRGVGDISPGVERCGSYWFNADNNGEFLK